MSDFDPKQAAELQRLSNPDVSETELFALLAESAGLGADEIDRVGEGRLLFSRIWQRHGKSICAHPVVKAYIANPTTSDATMVGAQIINLLVQVDGINVVTVAALALRIGLRALCAGHVGPDAPPQSREPASGPQPA